VFLDTAISGDRNVIERVAEKILQNKYLTIEIERVCNVNKKVIPVSMEATGTFSRSFRKYLNNIPGKHEIKILQTAVRLGTTRTYFAKN